jgi:hypothetical protein
VQSLFLFSLLVSFLSYNFQSYHSQFSSHQFYSSFNWNIFLVSFFSYNCWSFALFLLFAQSSFSQSVLFCSHFSWVPCIILLSFIVFILTFQFQSVCSLSLHFYPCNFSLGGLSRHFFSVYFFSFLSFLSLEFLSDFNSVSCLYLSLLVYISVFVHYFVLHFMCRFLL